MKKSKDGECFPGTSVSIGRGNQKGTLREAWLPSRRQAVP